jgi:hypothetical protein
MPPDVFGTDLPDRSEHSVVVVMGPNPHPQEILIVFDRQGAMSQPDPGPPYAADLLELERGMLRIPP